MIDAWGVDRPDLVSKADSARDRKRQALIGGSAVTGGVGAGHLATAAAASGRRRAFEVTDQNARADAARAADDFVAGRTSREHANDRMYAAHQLSDEQRSGARHAGRLARRRGKTGAALLVTSGGLGYAAHRRKVNKSSADKDAAALLRRGLKFAKPKPIKPTGPGSLRGRMDPSTAHWPSAAHRGEGSVHKMTTRQSVEGPVVAVREAASGARRKVKQQWMKLDQGVQPLLIGGSN